MLFCSLAPWILRYRFSTWKENWSVNTFKSKCRTSLQCMKAMPSQICRINMMQAFSVKIKSSLITRSNSSPPEILPKQAKKIQNLFTEEFVLDDSRPCHSQNMIYEIKYWWQILEIFSNRRVTSPIWHLYIYIYSDVQFVTVCVEEIFSNLFSNVKKSAFLRSMLFLFLILLTIL